MNNCPFHYHFDVFRIDPDMLIFAQITHTQMSNQWEYELRYGHDVLAQLKVSTFKHSISHQRIINGSEVNKIVNFCTFLLYARTNIATMVI